MKKIAFTLMSAFALLLGFSASAQNIDFGRGEVLVSVPADYSGDTALPLIVLLHGYGSNGGRQTSYMGFGDLVDDYDFLLVAPDGTQESQGNGSRFWNASDACCNFYESSVDDVAYVKSIIDEMKSRYNVDSNRVYLVGHSNGGFMSYRMAYEHAQDIAAIASLAGASHLTNRDAPPAAINILQIHGTADETIAYQGGDIRDNRYPSAMRTVQQWASYNGCQSSGKAREMRDLDASLPGHETGVLKFNIGCRAGGTSELWTIAAGTHVPTLSDSFAEQVIEWLYAHPKASGD